MKILLVHPEDSFLTVSEAQRGWDLIVDLGRAPLSTYEYWSHKADCRVVSLYDFAAGGEDQQSVKALLQLGMNQVVDRQGIDWWDIASLLIVDDLQRFLMVGRLAEELGAGCELFVSRPAVLGEILRRRAKGTLCSLEKGLQPLARRVTHYAEALANLDTAQVVQVLQDKFDPEHMVRRRLSGRGRKSTGPVTLLPSSYINVSRMAIAYAGMLPSENFLLVCSRHIGMLKPLPANVEMISLDSYFVPGDAAETASLLKSWDVLKDRLISTAAEFADAESTRTLARIPILMGSGLAVRDAWNQVFERENISGCLSTDDTAPDSRIPLILAKNRGVSAVACHHGALDQRMAIKQLHADFYLAKGEMERDYLLRVCEVKPERVVMGGPAGADDQSSAVVREPVAPWLVYFTEPYQADAWRADEVYRDLLPRLGSLAKACGLRLVFKLHPFESIKSIRRLLRKYLPAAEERNIHVLAGPISPEVWQNTKFALTVQSTVAMSCCARGIPVFLCAWLGNPYGGYIKQYARFGVGCVLETAEQIGDIPRLLDAWNTEHSSQGCQWQTMDPLLLHRLLHGAYSLPAEATP